MKRLQLIGVFLFLAVVGLQHSALAGMLCSDDYLDECDPALDVECLERYYGCGAFTEAIASLAGFLSPEQEYLRGLSYYFLYATTGSESLKCVYLSKAKNDLHSYLNDWQGELKSDAFLASSKHAGYLYNAAQLLENIKLTSSCPESALTRAEIYAFVGDYVEQRIESGFLGIDEYEDTLSRLFELRLTEFDGKLKSFVAAAVDSENAIALGMVQLQGLTRQLRSLKTKIDQYYSDEAIAMSPSISNWYGRLEGFSADDTPASAPLAYDIPDGSELSFLNDEVFPRARRVFGCISPEEYEALRDSTVVRAERLAVAATSLINILDEPDYFLNHVILDEIEELAGQDNDYSAINRSIDTMLNQWRDQDADNCDSPRSSDWWCR